MSVPTKQYGVALVDIGRELDRISGSHHIFIKDHRICPVPIHGKRDLAAGTLARIRKITGIRF